MSCLSLNQFSPLGSGGLGFLERLMFLSINNPTKETMRETQQDLIEVLKGLTKEIRQLREEFNPQIRACKIIELKEAEDKRESNAIARAVQRFEERKAKKQVLATGDV